MNKEIKILFLVLFLFLNNTSVYSDISEDYNITATSFSSTDYYEEFITQDSYYDFLKEHIFSQPEYTYALASEAEKKLLLTSAVRARFPTISGRVINDEVLDRNVNDLNSIRKRQDDSFDAVAEINQPLFSGGRINSQVKYARIEKNNSIVKKRSTISELILESNKIFLSSTIYFHVSETAKRLLNEILPLKEKMEQRVRSGAVDPVEFAVFQARLNTFQSKIYSLEAESKTFIANYEKFFNKTFEFAGFPRIYINLNEGFRKRDSFNVDIKENEYLAELENVKITRSQYLPQIGVQARYTEYDINKDTQDSDIRGGIYFSVPIIDFGKGWAEIQAAKAKARATKFQIEIEKKSSDKVENRIITVVESSIKAKNKLKDAYLDTQKQRQIINERILTSGFSPLSLIEASENELSQLQLLLQAEFDLMNGYYELMHNNQSLISTLRFIL